MNAEEPLETMSQSKVKDWCVLTVVKYEPDNVKQKHNSSVHKWTRKLRKSFRIKGKKNPKQAGGIEILLSDQTENPHPVLCVSRKGNSSDNILRLQVLAANVVLSSYYDGSNRSTRYKQLLMPYIAFADKETNLYPYGHSEAIWLHLKMPTSYLFQVNDLIKKYFFKQHDFGLNIFYSEEKDWVRHTTQQCPLKQHDFLRHEWNPEVQTKGNRFYSDPTDIPVLSRHDYTVMYLRQLPTVPEQLPVTAEYAIYCSTKEHSYFDIEHGFYTKSLMSITPQLDHHPNNYGNAEDFVEPYTAVCARRLGGLTETPTDGVSHDVSTSDTRLNASNEKSIASYTRIKQSSGHISASGNLVNSCKDNSTENEYESLKSFTNVPGLLQEQSGACNDSYMQSIVSGRHQYIPETSTEEISPALRMSIPKREPCDDELFKKHFGSQDSVLIILPPESITDSAAPDSFEGAAAGTFISDDRYPDIPIQPELPYSTLCMLNDSDGYTSDGYTDCDGDSYEKGRETSAIQSRLMQHIKDQRNFVRLAVHATEGLFYSGVLGISIMHEPNTVMTPPKGEIIFGTSENPADFPVLPSGQRRITPVLVCMPHQATINPPLSVSLPLRFTPHPSSKVKILNSDTVVAEQPRWQYVNDVEWFLHNDQVTLYLRHFCLYCMVEEQINSERQVLHKNVSVFLR